MRTLQASHLGRAWHRRQLISARGKPTAIGRLRLVQRPSALTHGQTPRGFISSARKREQGTRKVGIASFIAPATICLGSLLIYTLYPADELRGVRYAREIEHQERNIEQASQDDQEPAPNEASAWNAFTKRFENFSNAANIEWLSLPDKIVDLILPEWSRAIPRQIQKLQRELSTAKGSLADKIWQEAHDPSVNPEIQYQATVRVSEDLCDEETEFLSRRKKIVVAALARFLDLDEKDINPVDVPTIAMCGSGGGLRALVAGTGSLLAAQDDGLFDCITYTSGVSGSCWLQALYHSSITERRLERLVDHLKARLGVHIAFPPAAFSSVTSSPTDKLLLYGMVEKLRGDPNATFGLVDVYGILLAARLLVPKGELGVNYKDFKLSSQREYIKYGQNPLPIYTAVRHEIPELGGLASALFGSPTEKEKSIAKQEGWFQWFELTPYEFFCEEFSAGIPAWAVGRRFNNGRDVPPETGVHLPELRMPTLLGIFGSAFCATLSHYYREVRPIVKSLTGFATIDEMIYGYSEDLEKVHPIDPASIPNFAYAMDPDKLRFTTSTNIHKQEYIQLMDAGMSNNLPIYPLLRPGRGIDVIVAFDASADTKTDNWLSVADGYARQRGIKGWPIGIGWPKGSDSVEQIEQQLEEAQAQTPKEADAKLARAQQEQAINQNQSPSEDAPSKAEKRAQARYEQSHPEASELGYCTVWVGTTAERSSGPPPPSKAVTDDTAWQLQEANAGLTVVYLPFLANPDKVEGVDPAKSDYMSTWNFVYTPEQIDKVVALARANYDEGKEQIKRCVRAVYERKKKIREEAEAALKAERRRKQMRRGTAGRLGEGDHFS